MAKKQPPTAPTDGRLQPGEDVSGPKHRKRLERELAELTAAEAKLLRQLAKTRVRATEIDARIRSSPGPLTVDQQLEPASPSSSGPLGYCMRERRTVHISDPVLITYTNGRAAVRGICPTCGARVVALARRAEVVTTPSGPYD